MHWQQQQVLDHLATVEQASLSEIIKNVTFSYYCNEHKHLGAMMSRLVKAGRVDRIKPGVFQIRKVPVAANQGELFEEEN